jgi:hypothetical protein
VGGGGGGVNNHGQGGVEYIGIKHIELADTPLVRIEWPKTATSSWRATLPRVQCRALAFASKN